MSDFNSFLYGEQVYGQFVFGVGGSFLASFLTNNSIYVTFESEIVVNNALFDISNYNLTPVNSAPVITVKSINRFHDERTVTDVVQLVTDYVREGDTYTFSIGNLLLRDGSGLSYSTDIVYYKTKIDTILSSLPKHYDTRPESTIRNILAAIAISDHAIGGSDN